MMVSTKTTQTLVALFVVASVAVFSPNAQATLLSNGSFEADVLADGGFITTTTDWNDVFGTSVASGVFNPTDPAIPPVPDGVNVAFLNNLGFLSQTLPLALSPGDQIRVTLSARSVSTTLNVDIRTPGNVSILDGGAVTQVVTDNTQFTTFTLDLNVLTAEASPLLVLTNAGNQLLLDSVSAVTFIPEPSTGLMLGMGLFGLVARRRRNGRCVGILRSKADNQQETFKMKTKTTTFSALLAIAMVAVFNSNAQAISLSNGSFEADVVADGGFTTTTTDWNDVFATNGNSGVLNPTGAGTPPVPNGDNIAFLNSSSLGNPGGGGFLTQSLSGSLDVGDRLIFTVLARPTGATETLGVDIATSANVSILVDSPQITIPASSTFTEFQVELIVATAEATPLLVLTNELNFGSQLHLDSASLSLIPEPSTGLLLSFGLFGIVMKRGRGLRV